MKTSKIKLELKLHELNVVTLLEVFLGSEGELHKESEEILKEKLEGLNLEEYTEGIRSDLIHFLKFGLGKSLSQCTMEELRNLGNFSPDPILQERAREEYRKRNSLLTWANK